jgi:hypothetical protein
MNLRLTRRERILLLLRTYQDAFEESKSAAGSGRLESRLLGHGPVWHQGSYVDLQDWLERLKERSPSVHWHTLELYVYKRKARRRKADLGVSYLHKQMPSNIYVPLEISENAGFSTTEAKAAARPKAKAAA